MSKDNLPHGKKGGNMEKRDLELVKHQTASEGALQIAMSIQVRNGEEENQACGYLVDFARIKKDVESRRKALVSAGSSMASTKRSTALSCA